LNFFKTLTTTGNTPNTNQHKKHNITTNNDMKQGKNGKKTKYLHNKLNKTKTLQKHSECTQNNSTCLWDMPGEKIFKKKSKGAEWPHPQKNQFFEKKIDYVPLLTGQVRPDSHRRGPIRYQSGRIVGWGFGLSTARADLFPPNHPKKLFWGYRF
jgi:hypothetical protein